MYALRSFFSQAFLQASINDLISADAVEAGFLTVADFSSWTALFTTAITGRSSGVSKYSPTIFHWLLFCWRKSLLIPLLSKAEVVYCWLKEAIAVPSFLNRARLSSC